ncbi:MAG: type II toxin-antitoxin system Phd/YefM family antitoxin [Microthrixaceae bacterium]
MYPPIWLHWRLPMSEVGVRELRDNLSRYLASVQAGAEVVVTDHGRAIARLVGLASERPLDRLIAEGLVSPASKRRARPPRRVATRGSVSVLVGEQRR